MDQRGGHYPFFICSNGRLCGFALVQKGSRLTKATDVTDVAEFFVVRGSRHRGVGLIAAHAVLNAFPGRWEIRVRRSNAAALRFWSRAVETWTRRPVTPVASSAKGVDWDVLRIEP